LLKKTNALKFLENNCSILLAILLGFCSAIVLGFNETGVGVCVDGRIGLCVGRSQPQRPPRPMRAATAVAATAADVTPGVRPPPIPSRSCAAVATFPPPPRVPPLPTRRCRPCPCRHHGRLCGRVLRVGGCRPCVPVAASWMAPPGVAGAPRRPDGGVPLRVSGGGARADARYTCRWVVCGSVWLGRGTLCGWRGGCGAALVLEVRPLIEAQPFGGGRRSCACPFYAFRP